MYRGFNVDFQFERNSGAFIELVKIGENLYQSYAEGTRDSLDKFINQGDSLDGSALQSFWFPQISADIFISHSHKDIDKAKALSGLLWDRFELRAFIDYCVWGYGNDLLWEIDNKYCLSSSNPAKNTFDYQSRNHSTSHVHIMLSTALTMMIDRTECLFFLNTPNAIQSYKETDKTESPWIYSELAISRMIEKHPPERYLPQGLSDGGKMFEEKSFKLTHDVDLNHLAKLTNTDIFTWGGRNGKGNLALDNLYNLCPLPSIIK
jgi:hypothetical protein